MHPSLRLAVALKYEHREDVAPLVVAAGRSHVAEALTERARALGIPVHADEPLAQSLSVVPVGTFVPEELYPVVAQVLAMVYAMDRQLAGTATSPLRGEIPPAKDGKSGDD
jgi:flagellar biosynthesis protein